MELDVLIDEIVKNLIDALICMPTEGGKVNPEMHSRLIFPKKWKDGMPYEKRISEQEARFVFVRLLEKKLQDSDFYYSIETPTVIKHHFSGQEEYQRSGSFDLGIYKKSAADILERYCYVEFKFGNTDTVEKDLVKLVSEPHQEGINNYFIHIVNNTNAKTMESIKSKYIIATDCKGFEGRKVKVYFLILGKMKDVNDPSNRIDTLVYTTCDPENIGLI